MTGFGLYEVLRIFLPGAVAAAVLDLVLRLATGSGALYEDGPTKSVVASLSGVAFVFTALVFGFLLYLADLPIRARIHREGDPQNGIEVPWKKLDTILLSGAPAPWVATRKRSIYFLLTDAHLPEELHKKIYYFGGLYKMYFDARIVTVAALALGPAVGLRVIGHKHIQARADWSYLWPIVSCLTLAIIAGAVAEFGHFRRSIKSTGPGYGGRLGRALVRVLPLGLVIFLAQSVGWMLADRSSTVTALLGVSLCALSLLLWAMFELGPPAEYASGSKLSDRGLRDSILLLLRCEGSQQTQHIPAQRTFVDLALMSASLIGAATLTIQQGRPSSAVLLWAGFVLIPILIVAIRKHEVHLLNSYNDQSAWFLLNENHIAAWARAGPGADKWC